MSASPTATAHAVGTTAVKVIENDDAAASGADGRVSFEVSNLGSATVYVGGPTVTTSSGAPLYAGSARTFSLRLGGQVWAVSASAGQDVRVLKVP